MQNRHRRLDGEMSAEMSPSAARAVRWFLGEVIKSRGWEMTQGPAQMELFEDCSVGDIAGSAVGANDDIPGVQALIAESFVASGGNRIGVPAFEIVVTKGAEGKESYAVQLMTGRSRDEKSLNK